MSLTTYESHFRSHGTDAARELLRIQLADSAEIVIEEFNRRAGIPFAGKVGLVSETLERWYVPREGAGSPRWAYAKRQLGLPTAAVERISKTADEIVARLANPNGREIATRGLVLGHVQSGKTTSFLSVAAKALDNGYDLVIILAGVHNSLRRQTQDRAARTLVHQEHLWWLGTARSDFKPDGNSPRSHLSGKGKRGLLVVKKHQSVLEKLASWLERSPDNYLRELAVLVIDDEADQAGLDVSPGSELAGVHEQLSRVVNLQTSDGDRRCAYLAYTATPYANILTSQAEFGLYPRDFIYPLDKPDGYIGAEELFGDQAVGNPINIETDEAEAVVTPRLRDAIRWFVMATAARAAISGRGVETFHSSMLIHTTQSTEAQLQLKPAIQDCVNELADEFAKRPYVWSSIYAAELQKVPARPGGGEGLLDESPAAWTEVAEIVPQVLKRLIERTPAGSELTEGDDRLQAHSGVIVDNSRVPSTERLIYSDTGAGEEGVTVIAIGGNTLSRGLTLEGLVCSYFARTARTYDSLMQMGRWFGYRNGYRHLVRVWTTEELLDWFRELNVVEQDLRSDLTWMQENDFSPAEYGPRIRLSPNMNITRAAAMRSVQRNVSYSDYVIDPAWLDITGEAIKANQHAARILAAGLANGRNVSGATLFEGVSGELVRKFLDSYRFHPAEKRVDLPTLRKYLDVEREKLSTWNVAFRSPQGTNRSEFDFGADVGRLKTFIRGRRPDLGSAYIQSIIDSKDPRIDADGQAPANGARYRAPDEPPLLLIYPIDAESKPGKASNRVPLNAPDTVIGVAVALPKSQSFVEYVMPILPEVSGGAEADLGDFSDQ